MGQYHLTVNLDKKQLLHPNHLGDGLKLLEFGDGGATLTALAILLAQENGRGLGDLHVAMPDTPLETWEQGKCGLKRIRTPHAHLVGSWAGDRITIAGDYGDKLLGREENLYSIAQKEFEDISAPMRELINCDRYLKQRFADQFNWAESLEKKDSAWTSPAGGLLPKMGTGRSPNTFQIQIEKENV